MSKRMLSGRELEEKLVYIGMERAARALVLSDGLARPEDVVLMTLTEVCSVLAESYSVVAAEDDLVTLVKHEDLDQYDRLVKYLKR